MQHVAVIHRIAQFRAKKKKDCDDAECKTSSAAPFSIYELQDIQLIIYNML